ncbi:MXAN_6230/SCO0854 family RING domain-containing protein [Actinoplanes regularis]|uniref:MXAN_6230/SCO0854 family RING domain-containing protein n=1 Tax=Actinoplanes regularis TaxID=52697 RepID=UPI0024A2B315|nr:MXAN_6230/SCO0854 family RING domain-containing protein [Actinoplanes regularis]GLW32761.1 hypothetical protein Areg01_56990 [Actinoplanes regularis]
MDAVATVLLRRTARVHPPTGATESPDSAAWVATIEADLAARGWVLHRDLRAGLLGVPPGERRLWAGWLLAGLDDLVGADRDLTPLFRSFPDTPDVEALFVDRLLTHLFAAEGAPCVLCGEDGVGAPLDPCGHLVCRTCFPPAEFSGCPICGRRISAGSGYLPMTSERDPAAPGPALRVRVLRLDPDPKISAAEARDRIVARPHGLSRAERDDLRTLVAATEPDDLTWLLAHSPARETTAVVIAWALHATALTAKHAEVIEQARSLWGTATDVARTLWAYSGGDPGLILPAVEDRSQRLVVPVPRVRAFSRSLRRAALAHLDRCGAATAAEDVRRHPTIWKRLAERLHPFERVTAHPGAAVAFAALRGTRTGKGSPLGQVIQVAVADQPRRLVLVEGPDGRIGVRVRTHAAEVEEALAREDVTGAVRLLAERPGQLWRRLDHLLRAAGDDTSVAAVVAAAEAAAGRVAPGLIATASAELAGRDRTVPSPAPEPIGAVGQALLAADPRRDSVMGRLRDAFSRIAPVATPVVTRGRPAAPAPGTPRRLFFPASDVGRTWTAPERRDPLPPEVVARTVELADAELTRRAARLDRFDLAVIDATLADVPTPLRARVSSGGLANWPRGSLRDLPPGDRLRLFLHWEDTAEHRVDLDLSCVFFDENWRKLGHCDYTRLRYGNAAVHSGDFTSAPPPAGATEYLDLNLPELRQAGARYLVPVVLSYNNVPFELLSEAFAGLAVHWKGGGRQFDASRVAQRFDLRGNAKALMPMVIDVTGGRLLWTDVNLAARGAGHSVGGHAGQLAGAAADQWEYFAAGPRPTLLDLAAWHAAARADRVVLAFPDGAYATLPSGVAEPTAGAIRALAGAPRDPEPLDATGLRVLAAVTDADTLGGYIPGQPAEGSVALTVTGFPDDPWQSADAAELLGALTPE